MSDQPTLLSQKQICARFGISDECWRQWRKAQRVPLPVPNIPGRPRWRRTDIEAFERGLFGPGGSRVFFGSARRQG